MDYTQLLNDMLTLESEAAKSYDFALIGCTTPPVHDGLITILCDQHQINLDVKNELIKRKILFTAQSNPEEIARVKKQFTPL